MDFLDKVVDEYLNKEEKDFSGLCFVFPTRRACTYFRKKFAARLTHPVWSPSILSFEEFTGKLTDRKIADEIQLISELYLVYHKFFPEETFDKFYAWGELLLKDFDEIDRYLIDPDLIFRNIEEYKEIQLLFQPDEEDLKSLKEFWQGFSDKELTYLRSEFYKTWQVLPEIYKEFNERLNENNYCYEGAAYKEIAEKITKDEISIPYSKIVIAGFYALSKAEQVIFDHLQKKGQADILFDVDEYLLNPSFETYRFTKFLPREFKWKNNLFATEEKNIEIAGVPLLAGQAKYMGQKLQDMMTHQNFVPENTAVVLPETSLLFPVLNSLPEQLKNVNVTMGYPLKDTPLARLVTILSELQQHATDDEEIKFYHKDITNLLHNPLMRNAASVQIDKWLALFERESWIYITSSQLTDHLPAGFEIIFKKINSSSEVIPYLRNIMMMISNYELPDEIETDFISSFISNLNKFEYSLQSHLPLFDAATCWRAIKELIHAIRIPFEGEPLSGLQIMGFLETRNLDFENVIMLSCNEDFLPSGGKSNSFIPHPVRKGFGLPTYEERDAISAYHFYRLLQRAKNITLIYDTEIKSIIGGEKSRFLLQIEHELAKKYPNINLTKKIVSTKIRRETVKQLEVVKDKGVMEMLHRYTNRDGNEITKRLSASAIINYLNCPMQFYLRNVASLYETTDPDEHLDAIPFGKVLHNAIEILYKDKDILHTAEEKTDELIEKAVNTAIANEFTNPEHVIKGKNILLRDVIIELLKSIVKNDRAKKNLQIKDLEIKLQYDIAVDNLNIGLQGIADRVDVAENILRIVDYKTGQVYVNKSLDLEKVFSDVKFKAVFQALFYTYLYKKTKNIQSLKAGIYHLPKANSGINFLNNNEILSGAQMDEFEALLGNLLKEIFDDKRPFKQAEDVNRCTWCAYTDICHR